MSASQKSSNYQNSSSQYCINLRIDKHILDNSVDPNDDLEFYLVTKLLDKCVGQLKVSNCEKDIFDRNASNELNLGSEKTSKNSAESSSSDDLTCLEQISRGIDVSKGSWNQNCNADNDSFSSGNSNEIEMFDHTSNNTNNEKANSDNQNSTDVCKSNGRLLVNTAETEYTRAAVSATECSSGDYGESRKSGFSGSPDEDTKSLATIRKTMERRQSADSMTLRPLKRIPCAEMSVETDADIFEQPGDFGSELSEAKRKRRRRKTYSPYNRQSTWYQLAKARKRRETEAKSACTSPEVETDEKSKKSASPDIIAEQERLKHTPVPKSKLEKTSGRKEKSVHDRLGSPASFSGENLSGKTNKDKVHSLVAKERPKRNITAPRRFTLTESPVSKRKQTDSIATPVSNKKEEALNSAATAKRSSDEKISLSSKRKRRKKIEFVAMSDDEVVSIISDGDTKCSPEKITSSETDAFVEFLGNKIKEISNSCEEAKSKCFDEVSSTSPSSVSNTSSSSEQSTSSVTNRNQELQISVNKNQDSPSLDDSSQEPQISANSNQEPQISANRNQEPQISANRNQEPQISANRNQTSQISANRNQALLNMADSNQELPISVNSNRATVICDQIESASNCVKQAVNVNSLDSEESVGVDKQTHESKSVLNSEQVGKSNESTHEINTVAVMEFFSSSVEDEEDFEDPKMTLEEFHKHSERDSDQGKGAKDAKDPKSCLNQKNTTDATTPDMNISKDKISSEYLKYESELFDQNSDDVVVLKTVEMVNQSSRNYESTNCSVQVGGPRKEIEIITLDDAENEEKRFKEARKRVSESQNGSVSNGIDIQLIREIDVSPKSAFRSELCNGTLQQAPDQHESKICNLRTQESTSRSQLYNGTIQRASDHHESESGSVRKEESDINRQRTIVQPDSGIESSDCIKLKSSLSSQSYQSTTWAKPTAQNGVISCNNGFIKERSKTGDGERFSLNGVVFEDKNWRLRDQRCFLCFNGNTDLQCAKCPRVFHCACLIPPLKIKPET